MKVTAKFTQKVEHFANAVDSGSTQRAMLCGRELIDEVIVLLDRMVTQQEQASRPAQTAVWQQPALSPEYAALLRKGQ